ncbi:MAG: hypothetical protein KatS3mg003_0530 [Candidatus Nitrosocaldaceae archaeon]|nr:MAG: hypothetical protein KatS3mg003_0530 [Candidatus Nitrosocaldaceae archaeon]
MSEEYAVRKMLYKGSLMVNICDKELLGRTLKEGELEVNISKDYFYEQLMDKEGIIALLKECSIANLVGEKTIENALRLKLASELSIRRIDNVPFLMIFKFTSGY